MTIEPFVCRQLDVLHLLFALLDEVLCAKPLVQRDFVARFNLLEASIGYLCQTCLDFTAAVLLQPFCREARVQLGGHKRGEIDAGY